MIAVDTNILVYAHRPECPLHEAAFRCLEDLAASGRRWSIPFHCLIEFAAIVTTPRIWQHPSTVDDVRNQVQAWRECSTLTILADENGVWELCADLAGPAAASGGLWYDARIAAVCLHRGINELWTIDRDYTRFPRLRIRNPLTSA
ncbi:MAG: PIN domain-containing protein [Chloroflexota bacterium]|nr:MAG: PIN domain-containing protein [Chloroflexota bacterium]